MSFKTRLSLLAGSSLIAASLATVAFTGAALAPAMAFAADECAPVAPTLGNGSGAVSDDPSLNGAAADSFACSTTPFLTGITYSSNGNLTVTKTNTTSTMVTANGVNLTGNGVDSVTWNSSAGALAGGAGTAGPVIDVTTASGDINIMTAGVNGGQAGTTHGIRATSGNALTSTPGGNITISRTAGAVSNGVAGGQAAIQAVTNGGNVSITTAGANTVGRLRGIVAQTSGAGTINLTLGSAVTADATDGVAAIDTTAGSGSTTININGGFFNGGAGAVIRSTSAGTVTVQGSTAAFTSIEGRVDFSNVAGGVTFNTGNGSWTATGASVFSGVADTIVSRGASLAAGGLINLGGGADSFTLLGDFAVDSATLDFGTGADVFNVSGALTATGSAINFGADADTFNLSNYLVATNATLDFGAGADTFNQTGSLFWNGVTSISNLESFNNASIIYLGGGIGIFDDDTTDAVPDDILAISSGVFTGSDASRIALDANLGTSGSQIGCATATVSDCVNFTGATTAGSTLLRVQDISFSIDGGTIGAVVTLIEGSTSAEHFTLDPTSTYYAQTARGPSIRKPVVAYYFTYDDTNHRHVLIGAPTDEVFQVGTFAASAQEAWRATTGSWLTRQADLRATPGGLEASRGIWARIGAQSGERDLGASYEIAGLSLDYDLTQKQRIAHMVFGADLAGGAGWVVGGTVGFVRSDVEFDATPTEAITSGFSGGVYASYVAGPLFIDATANANILHIKADAPPMGLGLDVPMKFDLKSLGGQVEAGWRFGMNSGVFVEPLAGVSYVVTRIDDAEVPGGSGVFEFEEAKSLRIGAGARVGMDSELLGMIAGYSLTGRYWDESEGEAGATIVTASGSSAAIMDDFGGGFSEVAASLSLYGEDGGVSGFVNLGGKFADGYQAIDGSAGVRVRW